MVLRGQVPRKFQLPERVSVVASAGGPDVFYQGFGFAELWHEHGLPQPDLVVGSSGGVFVAMMFALPHRQGQFRDFILDDGFDANGIFDKTPWYDVALYGPQRNVFWETLEGYFGDLMVIAEELCDPAAKTEMIAVATSIKAERSGERGNSRKLHEAQFSSRKDSSVRFAKGVIASANVPFAYPVEIDGELYTDGAVSSYYPLDIARRGVDFCVGFCYEWDIEFSPNGLAQPLKRVFRALDFVPGVRAWSKAQDGELTRRQAEHLPAVFSEVSEAIVNITIQENMEREVFWARHLERDWQIIRNIEQRVLKDGLVSVDDKDEADFVASVKAIFDEEVRRLNPQLVGLARVVNIFTEPSGANLRFGLRKHGEWTREQRLEAIRYGRERAEEILRQQGLIQ